MESGKHLYMSSKRAITQLRTFMPSTDLNTIRAEVLFTSFLVEHNIPLSAADHDGPLLKMFPDSKVAQKYGCAHAKSRNISIL